MKSRPLPVTWTEKWQTRSLQLTDRCIKCGLLFHGKYSLLSVSSPKQGLNIRSILMSFVLQRYSIKFNCFPNGRFVTGTSQFQREMEVEEKKGLQCMLYYTVCCLSVCPVYRLTNSASGRFLPGGKLWNVFSVRPFCAWVCMCACLRLYVCVLCHIHTYIHTYVRTYTYDVGGLKIWNTSLLFGILEVH